MFTVRIRCSPQDKDIRIADLHEAGTLGVLENEQPGGEIYLVAWFDDEESAARFGEAEAAPDEDWSTAWQDVWVTRLVGERFYLTPSWIDVATPPGRVRLNYQAGMACGTGEHPGTRLALMGLELATRPGDTVLDVGCGSGILCRAAQLLGAFAIGCDIEAPDLKVAREHIAADYFVGSASAIRTKSVDIVTANINAEVLLALAEDLRRVARRAIVLSGFRPESVPQLEAAFGPAEPLTLEGWSALLIRN